MITCPDCNVTTIGPHLTHERTCPLGLAVDERCADDRRWFEAHPFATEYRRPPHWSEIADLKMWGLLPDVTGEAIGRVLVHQVAPGVRTRTYGDVAIMVDSGAAR